MYESNWKYEFDQEINLAENARLANNEGMARVCARRATGIVIEEYFRRLNTPLRQSSAYERIKHLLNHPDTPEDLQEIAHHFVIRVQPDHNLPIDVDLVNEAKLLKKLLLGDHK